MKHAMLGRPAAVAIGRADRMAQTAEGIEEYREMLQDGNPAELYEAKGEALWKQTRGPKNATPRAVRPRQGPGCRQGRLRRAAALLRRHRSRCRIWSRAS